MRVKFSLAIEPFSINNVSYKNKQFKTADYRQWEQRTFTKLAMAEPQAALKKLREAFDPKQHAFAVKFTFNRPGFFTSKGEISAQSMDLSNVEKQLLDVLFLPKFNNLPVPYGAPNINADDKFVISLQSRKKFGPAERIDISIALINKPTRET